ncbi:MAG: hypothetical protein APU95_05835 [Hadesarchaea archaeon YNP_N21]|jgi:endonuclease V-like protein UPF0215 family|nr:MAG: hypothetical protein APU95_05835 [Hadesarchaea archaeon YNP_N21]
MKFIKFWGIKSEIRTIGIDDGPFEPHKRGKVLLVGAVFRGGHWLDGVLSTYAEVDGTDATERVIEMVNRSRHRGQLRVVMTGGMTFGGFNVIDIKEIFEKTGLPVIAISRKRPDMAKIKRALKHLPNWRERLSILKKAGRLYPVSTKQKAAKIFMQIAGIRHSDAEKIVRITSTRSLIPEPLRVAHLIATGVIRGESTRGA